METRTEQEKLRGLTEQEAKALEKAGKSNVLPDQSQQSVASIIIGNVTYPYPGDAKLASDFINSL